MNLQTVLFGDFTPPAVANVRRYMTIGGEFDSYVPSALSKTIAKRIAQRKADVDKAHLHIRQNPETTAARIASHFGWGHNKACYVLESLLQEKRVKRHGQSPKTGGPQTYHYVAV